MFSNYPSVQKCNQYWKNGVCTYYRCFTLYIFSLYKLCISTPRRHFTTLNVCSNNLQFAFLYTAIEPRYIYSIDQACLFSTQSLQFIYILASSLFCVNTTCSPAEKSLNFFVTWLLVTAQLESVFTESGAKSSFVQ